MKDLRDWIVRIYKKCPCNMAPKCEDCLGMGVLNDSITLETLVEIINSLKDKSEKVDF